MTERPMGGSVDLTQGSIELMQSRRLTEDDNKGVIESLNETDSNGNGLPVNAKYFMQIFDYKKAVSLQREQQILIDQPAQYFFAFSYDLQKNKTHQLLELDTEIDYKPNKSLSLAERSLTQGDGSEITYHPFPLGKNKILVRFTNLADRFDTFTTHNSFVNITNFAQTFYKEANQHINNAALPSFNISEVTLSNNQLLSDLL